MEIASSTLLLALHIEQLTLKNSKFFHKSSSLQELTKQVKLCSIVRPNNRILNINNYIPLIIMTQIFTEEL